MLRKSWYLLLLLFIEGAALMATELMGAKLIAPFYGNSLYVWTSVLAITILGLTAGYFLGGRLSVKHYAARLLIIVLSMAAVLVFAMPNIAHALIVLTRGWGLITGTVMTCFLLLLPPMLCFGIVNPVVVRLMSVKTEMLGSSAGKVYFTSTGSGILATFLFGYYLIPETGLRFSATVTATVLALAVIIYAARILRGKVADEAPQQAVKRKTKDKKDKPIKPSIYLFAVLEGATVMIVELVAARMLAPYFGSSLYVWAAVIGITLLGLALGYYAGGRVADKYTQPNTLYWVLLIASLFLMFMHYSSEQLTIAFIGTNMRMAIILISLLLVLPPLLFIGMVPMLLIRRISLVADNAGKAAGNVFAVSSASGIIALLLTGFYIIPQFGLTSLSIITGIIVGAVPFVKLVSQKKYIAFLFLLFMLISLSLKQTIQSTENIKVQYCSEGLLGQILVTDVVYNETTINRALFVNRFGESFINAKDGSVEGDYIVYAGAIASSLPEKSDMLILGLGGASMANMAYKTLKLNVDVVELDERIVDVAHQYFNLDTGVHVIVDDARHYIETSPKKYDLIFFDVFHGDITPPHVYSLECFKKAKSLLNKNGLIVVNFFGFLNGDIGKAARSVYKTMRAAGIETKILPTTGSEDARNLLFVGYEGSPDFSKLRFPLLFWKKPVDIDTLFIDISKQGMKDAVMLTDDKPILDRLSLAAGNNWREFFNENTTKSFIKEGIPMFQ